MLFLIVMGAPKLSRRNFLSRGAMLAGGAHTAMLALGYLKSALAHVFSLQGHGRGTHVLFLYAGLADHATADELVCPQHNSPPACPHHRKPASIPGLALVYPTPYLSFP